MVTTILKRLLLIGFLAPIFAMLLSCAKPLGSVGSVTNAVIGRVPVLDYPPKPALELLDAEELAAYNALPDSLKKKLQGNDKKLKTWALQMQVAIDAYNDYAAVRNHQSDVSVGINQGPGK